MCEACWERLPRAAPQWAEGEELQRLYPGSFLSARFSLWEYSPEVERLVHLMKYERRPVLAHIMGQKVGILCASFLGSAEAGIVIPIPLHRARLRERGYNQSEILSRAISQETGWPVVKDALVRARPTRVQARLSRKERLANVRGAFAVRREEALRGRTCLLVDDVVTTGSTANECARILLEAGATEVILVTVAAA